MNHQQPVFRWNIPNALTILRFALVPIFLTFLLSGAAWATLTALIIFIFAALTDAVDGYLARRLSQITTFGKFADPLADKLLVVAAWLAFVELGELGAGVVMVMIGREFLVTGLRIMAVSQGKVIAAKWLGKLKTVIHIVMVVLILVGSYVGWGEGWLLLKTVMVWLSVLISIISGIHYFYLSRELFTTNNGA